jgi:hypothetical protein
MHFTHGYFLSFWVSIWVNCFRPYLSFLSYPVYAFLSWVRNFIWNNFLSSVLGYERNAFRRLILIWRKTSKIWDSHPSEEKLLLRLPRAHVQPPLNHVRWKWRAHWFWTVVFLSRRLGFPSLSSLYGSNLFVIHQFPRSKILGAPSHSQLRRDHPPTKLWWTSPHLLQATAVNLPRHVALVDLRHQVRVRRSELVFLTPCIIRVHPGTIIFWFNYPSRSSGACTFFYCARFVVFPRAHLNWSKLCAFSLMKN